MQNTFKIGRRLSKYKYLGVAVNSSIVFAFYFIYRYLFEASFPNFVGLPLFLIFATFPLSSAESHFGALTNIPQAFPTN